MAELTEPTTTRTSSCCSPETQSSCCELAAEGSLLRQRRGRGQRLWLLGRADH